MDHYQDVRVLPDPEFSEPTLLSALFAKLHRALAAYGKGDIGISFPQMQRTPGAILRLHGRHDALTALGDSTGLKDCGTIPTYRPSRPYLLRRRFVRSAEFR